MSDASATFSLDLESNMPATAAEAAGALENLRAKIEADTGALRAMQVAQRNLNAGGVVNIKTMRELKEKISAQKASIGQAQQAYISLGGTFQKTVKPAAVATESQLIALMRAMQGAGGPVGSFGAKLGGLSGLLKAGLVAGLVAVAAAILAVGAACVVAYGALVKYGIGQADARRSDMLRLEGLSKVRNYWLEMAGITRKADSADFLMKTLDNVSASTALGRDEVQGLQEDLYRAGLRGGNLQHALEGAAIVLSTQGPKSLETFKAMALGAGLVGGSVKKLSDDVKARLGGIAARQMLSFSVQAKKAKENINALFTGLKIEKLAEAVKVVTDLFSQSTVSGRALKALVEGMLQPLADWVANNGIYFKRFFQGMINTALRFGLAVLDVRDMLRAAFGGSELLKDLDAHKAAFDAGKLVAWGLVGAIGALAVAFLGLAVFVALALLPIALVGFAIYGLVELINGIDWGNLGSNIMKGIVNGIKAGLQWVKDAVTSVGESIQKAFAVSLKMRSPSRKMFEAGLNIDRGVVGGVRAGIPQVRGATEDMADAVMAASPRYNDGGEAGSGGGSAAAPAAGGGKAPASVSITIGDINIQGKAGAESPRDFALQIRQELESVLQGIAATMGAPA